MAKRLLAVVLYFVLAVKRLGHVANRTSRATVGWFNPVKESCLPFLSPIVFCISGGLRLGGAVPEGPPSLYHATPCPYAHVREERTTDLLRLEQVCDLRKCVFLIPVLSKEQQIWPALS